MRGLFTLAGDEGFDLTGKSKLDLPRPPFGLRAARVHWTRSFEPSSPGKSKTPTCHRHMSASLWLGMRDSNPRSRDQNPVPYHLANPQHHSLVSSRTISCNVLTPLSGLLITFSAYGLGQPLPLPALCSLGSP